MHEIIPQSYGWPLYVDVPIRELVATLFDPWRLKISKPRMHEIIPQSYGWPLYVDILIRELVATLFDPWNLRVSPQFHISDVVLQCDIQNICQDYRLQPFLI